MTLFLFVYLYASQTIFSGHLRHGPSHLRNGLSGHVLQHLLINQKLLRKTTKRLLDLIQNYCCFWVSAMIILHFLFIAVWFILFVMFNLLCYYRVVVVLADRSIVPAVRLLMSRNLLLVSRPSRSQSTSSGSFGSVTTCVSVT